MKIRKGIIAVSGSAIEDEDDETEDGGPSTGQLYIRLGQKQEEGNHDQGACSVSWDWMQEH